MTIHVLIHSARATKTHDELLKRRVRGRFFGGGGGAILVDISKFRGRVITKSLEILIELSIVIAQCTLIISNAISDLKKKKDFVC